MATKKIVNNSEKHYPNLNRAIDTNISEYAENSYLEYAMSVVKGRAIPSVEDGLKPVHRRILYTMHKEGLHHNTVPKKSARVVGTVLGFYHPHGDLSVYEALVRQAQDFNMRYTLIDGQGNFGSRDGDSFAASRYTECKLSAITQLYLDEMKDRCVDFVPNYDGTELEPVFLPSRVPFILLNGNPGIGVGIASDIPSHNLSEVIKATIHYIENPKTTIKSLMKYIKGPDFSTGAQIISSKADIEKVYNEGRGSIRLRAKYIVEPFAKSWKLVFNEIPYGVSVQKVMEEIDAIFNPEDKSKKDAKGNVKKISPEQDRKKKLFISNIEKYTDASNKDSPVRLVIEPKSAKINPEELANILFAYTSLECNFNANFTMIGRNGVPTQKNLLEIFTEWTDFRVETVRRRCEYHLEKIKARMHILEGRKIILSAIDEVIKIIKESENPKEKLMERFKLSEIQAEDVLELKLRQISRLELKNIETEYKKLKEEKAKLEYILSSQENILNQIVLELKEDLTKFGDKRITEINESEKVDVSQIDEKASMVAQEKITVAISKKGWVRVKNGEKTIEDFSFKDGDATDYIFHCLNTDTLAIFDSRGKVYNSDMTSLYKDTPINTLCDMGAEYFIQAFPINKEHKYLLAHTNGFGFIVKGENLFTRQKAGKEMFDLPKTAKMLPTQYIHNETDINKIYVGLISTENRVLFYKLSEISEIGKGKGVGLMGFNNGYKLKQLKLFNQKNVVVNVFEKKKTTEYIINKEEFDRVSQRRSVSAKGKVLNLKDKLCNIEFKWDKNTFDFNGV